MRLRNKVVCGIIALGTLTSLGSFQIMLPGTKAEATYLAARTARFEPIPVKVPGDPAGYAVLDVQVRTDGLIEILSRRATISETSYARRLVDCSNWTFSYLAEGDRPESLSLISPDQRMVELVEGSASTHISSYGCRAAGL
jgi:hypothetical protein